MAEDKGTARAPEESKPPVDRRSDYVVFLVREDRMLAVVADPTRHGLDDYPESVPTFKARTPAEAREQAFRVLTDLAPEGDRDSFTCELVSLAARGWQAEHMVWQVERKVVR